MILTNTFRELARRLDMPSKFFSRLPLTDTHPVTTELLRQTLSLTALQARSIS